MTDEIRFDDGKAYEEFMGEWSAKAGHAFLDWLNPTPGMRWVDVGCGNGAFTELLVQRCAVKDVLGVDPSEGQLAYARTRLAHAPVRFARGDAMALPCADASVDCASMALVIFFVPEPARGVAEMVRAVRPGGGVCAYAWDIVGGGFPYFALQDEMARLGHAPMMPPSVAAANLDALHDTWTGAGLVDVETRVITVERTFADFDEFWRAASNGPAVGPRMSKASPGDAQRLKDGLRARLPARADGRITCDARAHAVRGRRPA